MLEQRDNDGVSGGNRKTYARSLSWTDRSPAKSNSRAQWNSKARGCLPPLSITRPSIAEWPSAGSDDLGVWPHPLTPSVKIGSVTPQGSSSLQKPPTLGEFEFRKDKLSFFNKECSRIMDHIYLGSDTVAKNREVLKQNGITHVLNCVGFVCPEYFKGSLVYKTLWLQDSPSEDITSILYDVFDYFEDVREQGGRVFVHCCQGVSRSTSLVIAYLMWKEELSFEDAFQRVKATRGVTNPNMGFACQLLQCQKRVHALPASPTSALRMYRMAPHSPYDPLHLVPKMISEPTEKGLDSRGAFIIHVPSAIYVWLGNHCLSVMSDNARAVAFQLIRYEKARGSTMIVKEGEEPSEFWDALGKENFSADCFGKVENEQECSSARNNIISDNIYPCLHQKIVSEYDLDFDIFRKAVVGGVVPPFPIPGTESETCLPAKENGWSILRRKLTSGIMKEFPSSSKLGCDAPQASHGQVIMDTSEEESPAADPLPPSNPLCDSLISSPSTATWNTGWIKDSNKVLEYLDPVTSPSLSRTPSTSSLDSFSCFLVGRPKSSTTSPSLSPSTSDYSSSFTFSPSSSNWSDLSPSRWESKDQYHARNASLHENTCSLCKESCTPSEEAFSASYVPRIKKTCSACTGNSPSLAERRGSPPPPRMMLTSIDESEVPLQLARSWSFSLSEIEDDVMSDSGCNKSNEEEGPLELIGGELALDTDILMTDNKVQYQTREGDEFAIDIPSNNTTSRAAEETNLVLYQWPSMRKVEMPYRVLDSSSVYIIFVPNSIICTNSSNLLYVWVGHDASAHESQKQFISDFSNDDCCARWERVGENFLMQKGLAMNSMVQIIREGEEPEQLLKHLPCFSFQKAFDGAVN